MKRSLLPSPLTLWPPRQAAVSTLRGCALLLLAGSLAVVPARAQSPADSSDDAASSWYAFPTLFYTPETSLGGGGAGGYFFRTDTEGPPSSLTADVSVTVRGQYQLNLNPELYRDGDRQRLYADIALHEFPDVFYGLGPGTTEVREEDFTSRYVDAVLQAEQRVAPGLRIGLRGRVREEAITEVETDGRLSGAAVPGAEGGTTLGLGLVVTRDTRDRLFYPHRGTYVTASVVPHSGALGSDFDFTRAVIDARYYVPVGNHVIGLQGYGEAVSGTAPFTILPRLGGPRQLRGYREGRFRDDVFAAVQGEWRFPLWGRFNGAVFAGTGAVAPRLGALGTEGVEVAGGTGLRYRLNDEGTHLRLDYALGKEGGGLYITALTPF